MREKVIVVTPKGCVPDAIYEKGAIIEEPTDLPALTYHYGYLADHSDSESGDYDRIIVTTRRLSRGQVLSCERSEQFCSMYDEQYGQRIVYYLTYDAGNRGNTNDKTLERSYRGLLSTRKNIRRYFDKLQADSCRRLKDFHLSWFIPRY